MKLRKHKRITKGLLSDLRIERVDGVGAPATGHKWAIIKSEDGESTPEVVAKARAAVEALLKEQALTLSKETVDALKALASLLEMEAEFKSADEPGDGEAAEDGEPAGDEGDGSEAAENSEPEGDENGEGDDEVEKGDAPEATRDALKELIRETVAEMMTDEQPQRTTKAQSRQPKASDKGVAKGEGLFSNVIFGQ